MFPIEGAKFSLGYVVLSPAAARALEEAQQSPEEFLGRHVCGDWGDLDCDAQEVNEHALDRHGSYSGPQNSDQPIS